VTHAEAVATNPKRPPHGCGGELAYHRSSTHRIGARTITRDFFLCKACRSRIGMVNGRYRFTDVGNQLEAEGPLERRVNT
jgi:hypothetical protein